MQTTFTSDSGKIFAPNFFAVYIKKNGSTFKKVQDELNTYNFDEYDGIVKIQLYENGTVNTAPVMVDEIVKI